MQSASSLFGESRRWSSSYAAGFVAAACVAGALWLPPLIQAQTPAFTCQQVDVNLDGEINIKDYTLLVHQIPFPFTPTPADINQDGVVDRNDFLALAVHFGKSCSRFELPSPTSYPTATPTPEPTSRPTIPPSPTPTATPTPTPTPTPPVQVGSRFWSDSSPFNTRIPATATYTRDTKVGSLRPNTEEWSAPVYRPTQSENIPLVRAVVDSSGRTAQWPIPTYALPSTADDHHLVVVAPDRSKTYEFWNMRWVNGEIRTGGMNEFALNGNGISSPPNYRVVAAGFAVSSGMVIRENVTNPLTNQLDSNRAINHALTMSLHFDAVDKGEFIPPAVGGETNGRDGDIPMGMRFALPRDLDVDALDVHPLTRELARAARDYGVFVNDTNGSPKYNNKFVGTVRVETGLCQSLYGQGCDSLGSRIQQEMYQIIDQHGIYRVSYP